MNSAFSRWPIMHPLRFFIVALLSLADYCYAQTSADRVPGRTADGDIATAAAQILDAAKPNGEREAVIAKHHGKAAELLRVMTADLASGKEEYQRIPWIWRVAVAAGKRNDPEELKAMLQFSTPQLAEPLRDWQAVVIGGGIIDGVSRAGAWPTDRLEELIAGDQELKARWKRTVQIASEMAENEKTPMGTRYDALRILGADTWEARGAQLVRHLAKGVDAELQQGAVSGIGDLKAPQAAPALIEAYPHLPRQNQKLVLDALVRDESRMAQLLDAVARGRIDRSSLGADHKQKLMAAADGQLRRRAQELLGE